MEKRYILIISVLTLVSELTRIIFGKSLGTRAYAIYIAPKFMSLEVAILMFIVSIATSIGFFYLSQNGYH